jgi:hypothetical protein
VKQLARRDALQAVAGFVSAATVGTAVARRSSDSSTRSTADGLDVVPSNADAIVHANVDVLRQDAGMRTLTDAALSQRAQYASADGPTEVDTLLDDIESNWNTDPANLHRVTAFGGVGGGDGDLLSGYGGAILDVALTAEDVKSGIENLENIAFDEVRESGTVVYEPESESGPWVGALRSDRVVVGTEAAVSDTADVDSGAASAIDGALRGAYTDTRAAPVRFASRVPSPSADAAVPQHVGGASGRRIDLTPMDDATTLASAVYGDGDTRGLTATLTTTDAAAATDAATVVSALRDRLEAELGDAELAGVVGDVAVERDGTDVTMSVEKTRTELQALAGESAPGY